MVNSNSLFKTLDKKISKIHLFANKKALWAIIGTGIILRITQFLYNRSLTEGEAPLALNIIQRTYVELLKPLDYTQAAPIGFLLVEKLVANILGTSEYALRFFPLIASIIALFLFFEVAKRTIYEKALPVALILFAVGDHLIYFASEVKQYSSDVTITLLIILIATILLKKGFRIKHIFIFAFVGALSFWFSHPAVFTFCAAAMVLILTVVYKKDWQNLIWLCAAVAIAALSLGLNYFFSLESLSRSKDFLDAWQHSFMPLPPTSLGEIKWFGYVFLRIFKFPIGLSIYELFLAVLSFIIGCFVMFYKKKATVFILLLPILLTLIASGFRKYPFEGRLLLFITPSMVLIISEGIDFICRKTSQGSRFVGITLVSILLVYPICFAGYRVIKPRAPEELRPVMDYVNEHYEPGDVIYVYYASINAFKYYASRFNYTDNYIPGIEARTNWANYYSDLKNLRGNRRVWIMLSHITKDYGTNEEELFVSYLDILGTQLDAFRAPGASTYLYNLEEPLDL